jgi:hypothetical protein
MLRVVLQGFVLHRKRLKEVIREAMQKPQTSDQCQLLKCFAGTVLVARMSLRPLRLLPGTMPLLCVPLLTDC